MKGDGCSSITCVCGTSFQWSRAEVVPVAQPQTSLLQPPVPPTPRNQQSSQQSVLMPPRRQQNSQQSILLGPQSGLMPPPPPARHQQSSQQSVLLGPPADVSPPSLPMPQRSLPQPPAPADGLQQEWSCIACTFLNNPRQNVCSICNTPHSLNSPQSWSCATCTLHNATWRNDCELCSTPRPPVDQDNLQHSADVPLAARFPPASGSILLTQFQNDTPPTNTRTLPQDSQPFPENSPSSSQGLLAEPIRFRKTTYQHQEQKQQVYAPTPPPSRIPPPPPPCPQQQQQVSNRSEFLLQIQSGVSLTPPPPSASSSRQGFTSRDIQSVLLSRLRARKLSRQQTLSRARKLSEQQTLSGSLAAMLRRRIRVNS